MTNLPKSSYLTSSCRTYFFLFSKDKETWLTYPWLTCSAQIFWLIFTMKMAIVKENCAVQYINIALSLLCTLIDKKVSLSYLLTASRTLATDCKYKMVEVRTTKFGVYAAYIPTARQIFVYKPHRYIIWIIRDNHNYY